MITFEELTEFKRMLDSGVDEIEVYWIPDSAITKYTINILELIEGFSGRNCYVLTGYAKIKNRLCTRRFFIYPEGDSSFYKTKKEAQESVNRIKYKRKVIRKLDSENLYEESVLGDRLIDRLMYFIPPEVLETI